MRFAVQYLEDGPGVIGLTPMQVRLRLRSAFARLPISDVLLGWHLPPALFEACREETGHQGARLFRWHPLLTGDGMLVPRPEWQTVGLDGKAVPGFGNMPEFTFVCPNRPPVRKAVLAHLRDVMRDGKYQGVFLDRIRYPSPATHPSCHLACFCADCCRVAWAEGFDLIAAQRQIRALVESPERASAWVQVLLDPAATTPSDPDLMALRTFLLFHQRCVTRLVQEVAEMAHGEGWEVGLDCFSPALAGMVGQDLSALNACADWVKIMSYGHALGPASLPFELLGLADWLVNQMAVTESAAMGGLSLASRLPLPATRQALREDGLSSQALSAEVRRARAEGVSLLLAGVELVEIAGVSRLHPAQIVADLQAFCAAGADGLVLSWDLWHIPLERLELVRHSNRERG